MIGFYNYTVILTYIGLASSLTGIFLAMHGQHITAAIVALMISGLCDMFDGKIARTRQRTDDEKKFGIQIVAKMPSEYHLKVTDERQAREFLASMMQDNVPLVKFELREPSLHEIFVEKVGDDNEER